uniref:Secreted protein n=1 Tax=Knipowitschia caucasica TaxID=637954 RepID=A0AAV2KGL4_KNICA
MVLLLLCCLIGLHLTSGASDDLVQLNMGRMELTLILSVLRHHHLLHMSRAHSGVYEVLKLTGASGNKEPTTMIIS